MIAGDRFEFFSAGTCTKPRINQDAVRLMKDIYGLDMEKDQYSKTGQNDETLKIVIEDIEKKVREFVAAI